MKEAFVVGDVHGKLTMLQKLLKSWQPDQQQLIFVGDLIDRGEDIKGVLDTVRQLQKKGAWVIRGNHEAMLLQFLRDPKTYWSLYQRNGGITTIQSLTQLPLEELLKLSATELVNLLTKDCPWLLRWLESLPLYIEYGQWIIVHAGVDLNIDDWRQTEETRFYWIREDFHHGQNNTGKNILFGHTPVAYLHGTTSIKHAWYHQNKWGIDGGAVYGGALIGLHITQSGQIIEEFNVL